MVFFSIVAFKTHDILQGSAVTQLMYGGIFSDSIITNFLLILRLILILVKLRHKKIVPFWATLYTVKTIVQDAIVNNTS